MATLVYKQGGILRHRYIKAVVRFSIGLLLITGVFLFIICILSRNVETNDELEAFLVSTLPWVLPVLIILLYLLGRNVKSSWEKMSSIKQIAIVLLTLPTLPFTLYVVFGRILLGIAYILAIPLLLLVFLFFFLRVNSAAPIYTSPSRAEIELEAIERSLREINKKI